ncbi:MAG: hypothetical protein HXS48_10365 [Theionarchaea archaeon]|nr:hypothetical protein [Theionarchaea archaeon]
MILEVSAVILVFAITSCISKKVCKEGSNQRQRYSTNAFLNYLNLPLIL